MDHAPWYSGATVLEHIDGFVKQSDREHQPFRFPVQDIYKFTEEGDDRRIVAGTIEAGAISAGDEVVFLPSHKRSRIVSIEAFNLPAPERAIAGQATGFTLADELYIRPGELMGKAADRLPAVTSRFRANVFWMGKAPLIKEKKYKLKLAAARAPVRLLEIISVLDAAELTTTHKQQVERHEVAQCIFETTKPVALDCSGEIEATGRFVLVDNYEIAGGGIVTEVLADTGETLHEHIRQRESMWEASGISPQRRNARYGHKSKFIVITGPSEAENRAVARALELRLFEENHAAYYLGIASIDRGLDADVAGDFDRREERVRRLGELARIFTDSGQIFITSIADLDVYDAERLKALNTPHDILIVNAGTVCPEHVVIDLTVEAGNVAAAAIHICEALREKEIIPDYSI